MWRETEARDWVGRPVGVQPPRASSPSLWHLGWGMWRGRGRTRRRMWQKLRCSGGGSKRNGWLPMENDSRKPPAGVATRISMSLTVQLGELLLARTLPTDLQLTRGVLFPNLPKAPYAVTLGVIHRGSASALHTRWMCAGERQMQSLST